MANLLYDNCIKYVYYLFVPTISYKSINARGEVENRYW